MNLVSSLRRLLRGVVSSRVSILYRFPAVPCRFRAGFSWRSTSLHGGLRVWLVLPTPGALLRRVRRFFHPRLCGKASAVTNRVGGVVGTKRETAKGEAEEASGRESSSGCRFSISALSRLQQPASEPSRPANSQTPTTFPISSGTPLLPRDGPAVRECGVARGEEPGRIHASQCSLERLNTGGAK
jgi:hypothetical protein